MARNSRSRSPARRERQRYANDDRYDSEERRKDRSRRQREEEDERNVRSERYRRRRYDDDEEKYGRRSEPWERDRDADRDRRRGRDERDREWEDKKDRKREYRDREREDEARAGPSTSRRDSRQPSSVRSYSRSKSPSSDKEKDKVKPNFNQSGLLAAATNTVRLADGTSTVLKYNEPPEARKPPVGWRLYIFKGKEQTDLLHIHRQSCYLIGRDKAVVDIYIEHPSCSKQHAVIQYRQVQEKDEFGSSKAVVKPFIIDLESTNNTFVNDEAIPTSRYYELKTGDVIKFGMSTREYVLLHDEV
ncbi:SMAD/FHA domain-containing protein [Fomitiporia mediterranea MF3/22]|uniref:SMAD/FHA domain-containing protein n=1 Tax=Fomitiporia mediterranea (strain MF3/22) TaxID=694068 RepID=UPI0004408894|nr:SMAD/FHA domain-containing protein [Fomitiporia mediterranea MF3/22]EJC97883.1 SMAD/FHA domain-containing protein [Fomitiporia mediterranea MF3/22]